MSFVSAIKYVTPHGLVQQIFRSKAVIRRRLADQNAAYAAVITSPPAYTHRAAIEFHRARGLNYGHLTGGSMPESALDFCCRSLDRLLPSQAPLIGLHVGNFLGVSLSHFVNYVRQRDAKAIVVSIDPNIQHQGVESPQNHVIAILNHFGLQKNAIISVGYSTHKTVSNDGVAFVGENGLEYDPYSKFNDEQSCEDTLVNLALLSPGRFDFAVVDGNHEGAHLHKETALLRPLLKPDGVLILDDVSEAWSEIKTEYDGLQESGWRSVGADGRVGLLQRA